MGNNNEVERSIKHPLLLVMVKYNKFIPSMGSNDDLENRNLGGLKTV